MNKKILSLVLCICLFMFVFVVKAGGQQERVNLDLHDVTIKVVLDEIQKQTNLSFLFNPEQTNKIGTVSVQANNETVQSVLDRMFLGTDLIYRFRDDLIVIYQKSARAMDEKRKQIRIVGRVTDESKMPLPGVTVLVKDLNLGTATSADGTYKLTLPPLKDTNFISQTKALTIKNPTNNGNDIFNYALDILEKCYDGRLMRLLGVTLSNLIDIKDIAIQMTFFDYKDAEEDSKTKLLINDLNRRLSKPMLIRASQINKKGE